MKFTRFSDANNYHAIGSKIIGAVEFSGELSWRCPGGQSILRTKDGKVMMAVHTRTNFKPGYYFYLQLHQMFFTPDGWPVLNQNEYYNDYNGHDESLAPLTVSEIAGTYQAVITRRGAKRTSFTPFQDKTITMNEADEVPTPSAEIKLGSNGKMSGAYTGSWSLAEDGYTVTFRIREGTFTGYMLRAVDWARSGNYRTITFTTICAPGNGAKQGEYFFGNRM